MRCTDCVSFYGEKILKIDTDKNLRNLNTFILGSVNFRASTVNDHEKSRLHQKAHDHIISKEKSATEKAQSEAGRALLKLKSAEKNRLTYLFRNAHAIAKNNRPLTDFTWLCEIDKFLCRKHQFGETSKFCSIYRNITSFL